MDNIGHHLQYVNVLLLVSVALGAAFRFLKLSPVLGYFVAGALIAKFVEPGDGIHIFAEFGIVFLLFVIGLELTTQRLLSMSKHVFGFGSLQIVLTVLTLGLACYFRYINSVTESFVVGAAFAMSSTAIVLQVLQTTNRQSTPVGRLALAVLIMQDLVVVPLLVLVPLLHSSPGVYFFKTLFMAITKGGIVVLCIFVAGNLLLRPLFRAVVSLSSQELFLSTTILVILGTSYLTEHFGLSMAMGAFVAGLLLAETEYRDEVEHVVTPFKSLLLGLFFMTVGMSMNFDMLLSSAAEIALIATTVIFCKASIIFVLCRLFGFRKGSAIQAGLLLSQGGEFAFILLRLASTEHVLSAETAEKFMMVITVTMAVTPLLAAAGNKIAEFLGESATTARTDVIADTASMRNHVIIVGFSNFGKTLARILSIYNMYYVACDINATVVSEAQKNGHSVYKGDATRTDIYDMLSAKRAISVVVALSNSVTAHKVVKLLQDNFPNVKIMVYMESVDMAKDIDIGDKHNIYAAELEGAIKLTSRIIMENFDINPEELVAKMHGIRNSEYNAICLQREE